jgi:hypothetical protein
MQNLDHGYFECPPDSIADVLFSVPYQCDDRDCAQQWHLATYWTNENAEEIAEGLNYTVDEFTDGDHEAISEDDLPSEIEQINAWNRYYSEVSHSGEDVLGQVLVRHTYKAVECYKIKLTLTILGVMLVGAKRNRKEIDHRNLPPHVSDYLCCSKTHSMGGPILSLTKEEINAAGIELNRWQDVRIIWNKPRSGAAIARDTKRRARQAISKISR